MFELINKKSPWDDMWRSMAAMMQYPFNEEKTIEKAGLKSLIGRPHNIVDVTDKDGNTIAQRLEVVTTPFKKDEVKVSVKSNFLTVECASQEEEEDLAEPEEKENYIYKGISSKNYEFSVKLGEKIDQDNIQAKNQDGILTVTLPFKKEEKLEEGARQIEVK